MTSAQSDDATDPEVDPDAAVAALELAVLLEDPIKGGIGPRLRNTTWSLALLQVTNC
jgi:hypothetical protein